MRANISTNENQIAAYRERCQFTQTQLAQRVGIGLNTLNRYENYGAATAEYLLRLAEFFVDQGVLSDTQAVLDFWAGAVQRGVPTLPGLRALADSLATPTPQRMPIAAVPTSTDVPPRSRVPFAPSSRFFGRATALQALAAALRTHGATAVISGMAGRGKTRLATEFVRCYGRYFPGGVFWVSFADANTVAASVAACGAAQHLDLHPSFDALPPERQVALVQAAWLTETPRLLVFDNCEDPALLGRWRPARGGCRVLVTSRRAHWHAAHVARTLPLALLERAESMALLRSHCAALPDDAADALAAELGDLPLALHLAGSYLARYAPALDAASYIAQLRAVTIAHPSLAYANGLDDYNRDVARTLLLSYERLDADSATDARARALLARAAHLAPGEPIPRELLLGTLELPAGDGRALRQAEDALVRLVNDLGLLELVASSTLRMHRLIGSFVRARADDQAAHVAVERTFITLEQQRADMHDLFAPLVMQHMQFVTDAAMVRADERAATLATILGWSLTKASRYQQARHYAERALAISAQTLGAEHAQTAEAASMLGILCLHTRRYTEARALLEQALATRTRVLGCNRAETAWDANNLGALLMFMGRLEEAQKLFEQELDIQQRVSGAHSLGTARTHTWLGYNALRRGGFAQAEQLFRQALAIQEQLLPADHPATALSLANVGDARLCQGDFDAAEQYVTRSLEMRQRLFGMQHVGSCESITLLGHIARCRGDRARGRALLEEALPSQEMITVAPQYDVLIELAALTMIAEAQGDGDANDYAARCTALIDHACASADLNAAIFLENQARLWTARGDLALAERLYGWAEAVRATAPHPDG